ncbi:bifunctional methylenetetrahydrofolate dehydrogenase/methenyltetrahydrofolate cyclohydrolase FolD [Natranaerofaba carboxydovora]|uniref:bifunctional methylenetetrahydrofolate dehydrogenase/methenyltetrahydrofolate cyclohydrolase FolD n=1 Tax=Natranaerofaba carboxydovora TaxID=2742683 RepID=UPI001F134D34|nr:bifunctional methylenetetrahydrofolate dehydrogenase/methenyltetrahydrofolate cyclohydrolase FolD [Natranaerofaba carboxydovora]UMZ73950.1 Bifunctional protein FolD protein [Natranaerofaba carboxydovora]
MSAELISGKEIGKQIREELKKEIEQLKNEKGITPGLNVLLVGEDPASQTYVGMKEKTANNLGIKSVVERVPADITQEEVLSYVKKWNNDDSVHGILVQLPLPDHIDEGAVLDAISIEKDVDGFHPENVGNLVVGQDAFVPCTPYGIIKLLEYSNVDINGKHAVVLGRSNIVGKPISLLLLERNATVTICHSRTKNLEEVTKQGDIFVVAVGRPEMVTGDMIKPGAVVIDVGVNRVEDKLVGDVEFESAKNVAGMITPVPGGVGPMTITMLMNNTLESAKRHAD